MIFNRKNNRWNSKAAFMLVALLVFAFLVSFSASSFAMGKSRDKTAIVLAGFGTTYPKALVAITNIQRQVQRAFPGTPVKIAFTSNIIRGIWHSRQHDRHFLAKYKSIPREILYVKGPLAAIADLQDEGYNNIIVQPTHIYAGEEYTDLCNYVSHLAAIKTIKKKYMPFKRLVIGRPLLGKPGPDYDYHEDIKKVVKLLKTDVDMAKAKGAALVYMGHGNEFFSTGIYAEFQKALRKAYPDMKIFVGTVEGFPSLDDVMIGLKHNKVRRVYLKPFMIVAGDHANNDMAGPDDDSWKTTMKRAGISVYCSIHGLGENTLIAKEYVQHIRDVAHDNHIVLK